MPLSRSFVSIDGFSAHHWLTGAYFAFFLDGLACIILFVFYRPAQRRPDVSAVFRHHKYKIMAIDPVGIGLLACSVPLLYYGLISALNPYKWSDAHVLGPLCAGLAGFACFAVWGELIIAFTPLARRCD